MDDIDLLEDLNMLSEFDFDELDHNTILNLSREFLDKSNEYQRKANDADDIETANYLMDYAFGYIAVGGLLTHVALKSHYEENQFTGRIALGSVVFSITAFFVGMIIGMYL